MSCFSLGILGISVTWQVTSVSVTLGLREISCELVKFTRGNTFSARMVLSEPSAHTGEFGEQQHLLSQMLKYSYSQIHHSSQVW